MSNEITITVPAISPDVISAIEQETVSAEQGEIEALAALREKYGPLARHNGFIKIGYSYRGDGSNWREEREYYYERDGKRVHGLLAVDNFESPNTDRNRGLRSGYRIYLLETGEWLRIERDGNWSQWQGEPEEWACGEGITFAAEEYDISNSNGGSIRVISDAEVTAGDSFEVIIKGLAKELGEMRTKLPERLTRIRQRAALASELLAKLTA